MSAADDRDPLALPFDVYQRYRLVADVLGRLRQTAAAREGKRERRLRVLDVGGRTAVLRGFDPDDDVALVDVEPLEGVEGLVLGDGARLPFQDDAFDVVCAFDTLEHVPPPARDAFVDECARVARSWVVLAGPYDAPEVVRAEETLQRFLKEKLAFAHRYLDEHRRHGLPDRARVEARLAAAGAEVVALGHANLDRWLAFLSASFYLDLEPDLRPLARAFFRFYNANLYASDHAPPVYRHAVIAALGGAPLPDLAGLLDPPVAPAGALAPFGELERELLAFDRARGRWHAEEAGLRETIATLEADLKSHGETLRAARATIDDKDAAIAAVESDRAEQVAGFEAKVAALEEERDARDARIRELGMERDALEARADALQHVRAAELEQNLAFERGQVADRDAELARLAAEIRANAEAAEQELAARDAEVTRLGAALDAAEADREAQRHALAARAAELADRERVLAEHRDVLAARDRQVAEQGEHIGNLEAHLRDRNAELKRWPMAALRRVMWLAFGKPPTA
jgi:hypothetical protein